MVFHTLNFGVLPAWSNVILVGPLPQGLMIDAWGDPLFRVMGKGRSDRAQFGSPEASEQLPRRLVAMGFIPDRFWAIPTYRMELTEWGLDETKHRGMTVPNTAFPNQPTDEPWNGAEGTPPPAAITHLATDPDGLIWVRPGLRLVGSRLRGRPIHTYRRSAAYP